MVKMVILHFKGKAESVWSRWLYQVSEGKAEKLRDCKHNF